jgi:hypothetical protein
LNKKGGGRLTIGTDILVIRCDGMALVGNKPMAAHKTDPINHKEADAYRLEKN